MRIPPALGRTWQVLLDWVFPPKCGGCGRTGQWFCGECRSQVSYVNSNRSETHPAFRLRASPAVQRIHSIAWYDEPLRSAIHNFKYKGQKALRQPLAELLAENWEKSSHRVDLLVAVPLHPKRERERGYNQSYLLATEFSKAVGIPAVKDALRRVRHTAPQVSLTMQERWNNVHDAFQGDAALLSGKSILLIDDVCTTGATLEACGRAAVDAGAQAVWAVTVVRPREPWRDAP